MLSLALLAAATMLQPGGKSDVPAVRAAHFLVSDSGGDPVETSSVPYRPGRSCYNWVLDVAPEDREVSVREVFELPDSAQTWGEDPAAITRVNRDRSTAVTEFTESLADGIITHGWCVAEGDPTGPHRIRVFAGERLLHEFRFNVVAEAY